MSDEHERGPGSGARGAGSPRRPTPQHLDTDALNAVLDDRLDAGLRPAADAHLAVCPDCRRELDELRATIALLRDLPTYRPRRSFQLGSRYARPVHASRLGRWLPMLPRVRTAAAVVALLLAVVTAVDVFVDDRNDGASSNDPAVVVEAPADAREPAGRGGQTSNDDEADPAPGNVGPADEAVQGEVPADDAAPAVGRAPVAGSDDGGAAADGPSVSMVVQIVLGIALVGLVILMLLLQRLANRARRLHPGF